MTRVLRSHPGYVSLAGGILALAVDIDLLVFSVVNALWVRPLPVHDPERVVTILQSMSTVTSLDVPALEIFDGPLAGQVVTTGVGCSFALCSTVFTLRQASMSTAPFLSACRRGRYLQRREPTGEPLASRAGLS